jgi:hypothetical protein
VWPSAAGLVRGQELPPLHPSRVEAAAVHPELARLLCLLDSLRGGDVRVRSVAARELHGALTRRRAARSGRRANARQRLTWLPAGGVFSSRRRRCMFDLTWADDGRATFSYGESRREGEVHRECLRRSFVSGGSDCVT